ncbi:MAG: hypothetical protein LBV69_00785 [Bacteroidales bacterium]|jgi:hypothetical protein|nr:hypothetical protein [Bacteroidales bacterium]
MENEIITYFLQSELLLHFDIVSIKESGDASQAQGVLHILLEEKNFLRISLNISLL